MQVSEPTEFRVGRHLMILRKIIPILSVYSCLSLSAPSQTAPPSTVEHTQDFSEIVVPIASVKLVGKGIV